MPDQHWDNLKQIFHAAVALPPGARPTYLDKACEGDLSLRAAVESLLKSHEDRKENTSLSRVNITPIVFGPFCLLLGSN